MILVSLASFRIFDWHRVESDTYEIRCLKKNGRTKPGIEVVTPSGTYFSPADLFGCEDKKQAASGKLEMYRAHSDWGYMSLRIGDVVFVSYLSAAIIMYLGLFAIASLALILMLGIMGFAFAKQKKRATNESPKVWKRQFIVAPILYVVFCYVLMIFGNRAGIVLLGMQLAALFTSAWGIWLAWKVTNWLNETDH
jgi:uncharacterized membrane protein YhdT